jgi:hypothetical protein
MRTQQTEAAARGAAMFPPELTLGEARARFFEEAGFAADGGYGDYWVEIRAGRVPLWFPNTEGRRRAVPFHDVHHILTGYSTTLPGETEIAAWEVATGLRRHYLGWLLDLLGFAAGLVLNPRRVYRAFVRGLHSANLYGHEWDDALLAREVGELRRLCGLDRPPPAHAPLRDKVSFALWAFFSVIFYVPAVVVLFPPVALLSLAIWYGKRKRA